MDDQPTARLANSVYGEIHIQYCTVRYCTMYELIQYTNRPSQCRALSLRCLRRPHHRQSVRGLLFFVPLSVQRDPKHSMYCVPASRRLRVHQRVSAEILSSKYILSPTLGDALVPADCPSCSRKAPEVHAHTLERSVVVASPSCTHEKGFPGAYFTEFPSVCNCKAYDTWGCDARAHRVEVDGGAYSSAALPGRSHC